MAFGGCPVEALELFEGLEADGAAPSVPPAACSSSPSAPAPAPA